MAVGVGPAARRQRHLFPEPAAGQEAIQELQRRRWLRIRDLRRIRCDLAGVDRDYMRSRIQQLADEAWRAYDEWRAEAEEVEEERLRAVIEEETETA
jgi:hypothetical protein